MALHETTVMAAEISYFYSITGINNILKYIKIGNSYFNESDLKPLAVCETGLLKCCH